MHTIHIETKPNYKNVNFDYRVLKNSLTMSNISEINRDTDLL